MRKIILHLIRFLERIVYKPIKTDDMKTLIEYYIQTCIFNKIQGQYLKEKNVIFVESQSKLTEITYLITLKFCKVYIRINFNNIDNITHYIQIENDEKVPFLIDFNTFENLSQSLNFYNNQIPNINFKLKEYRNNELRSQGLL